MIQLTVKDVQQQFKIQHKILKRRACAAAFNFTYVNSMAEPVEEISFSEAFAGYAVDCETTQSPNPRKIIIKIIIR